MILRATMEQLQQTRDSMSLSFTLNADDALQLLDFLLASYWDSRFCILNEKSPLPQFVTEDDIQISRTDRGMTFMGSLQVLDGGIIEKQTPSPIPTFKYKLEMGKDMSKPLHALLPKKGRSKNFLRFTFITKGSRSETLEISNSNSEKVEIKLTDFSKRVSSLEELSEMLLQKMTVKNSLTYNPQALLRILNTVLEISDTVELATTPSRQTYRGESEAVTGEFRINNSDDNHATNLAFFKPSKLALTAKYVQYALENVVSDSIKLTFMSDFPIFMESESTSLKQWFILAPRITESEEEDVTTEDEDIEKAVEELYKSKSEEGEKSSEHDENPLSKDSGIVNEPSEEEVKAEIKKKTKKTKGKKREETLESQSNEPPHPFPSIYEVVHKRGYVNPETRLVSMDKEYQWDSAMIAIADSTLRNILREFTYAASEGVRRSFTEDKLFPVIAVESLKKFREDLQKDETISTVYDDGGTYSFYERNYAGIPKSMMPFITGKGFTPKGREALNKAVANWLGDHEFERDRVKENGDDIMKALEGIKDVDKIGAFESCDISIHSIPMDILEISGIGPGTGKKRSFGAARGPSFWQLGKSFIASGGKASSKLMKKMKLAEDKIRKYYKDEFKSSQKEIDEVLKVFYFTRDDLASNVEKSKEMKSLATSMDDEGESITPEMANLAWSSQDASFTSFILFKRNTTLKTD